MIARDLRGLPSIRGRLAAAYAALSGVLFCALAAGYLWSVWDLRDNEELDSLDDLAVEMVGHAVRRPSGEVDLRMDQDELVHHQAIAGFMGAVHDEAGGQLIWEWPQGASERLPRPATKDWRRTYVLLQDGGSERQAMIAILPTKAGPLRVSVIRDRLPNEFEVWLVRKAFTVILPVIAPLLLIITGLGVWTVHRAIGPVARVARSANAIDAATVGKRLDTNVPREVRPLIDAVNRALDRLTIAFEQERHFTATAAHELRTPIAVLRARLDGIEDSTLAASLRQDVDKITRVVEQLLAAARADRHLPAEKEPVDVAEVARDVIARLVPLAVSRDRDLALTAPSDPLVLEANREGIEAALRNLIENGLRFTPAGTCVDIAVARSSRGVAVEVADQGPGIPPDERLKVFDRFWSGRDRSGVAGLGLAIVREIAERHGGSISILDRPGGGALFRLELAADGGAAD